MSAELRELEKEVQEARKRLAEARREAAPEPVGEYIFEESEDNKPTLSDFFGDKSDLLVIHNMGKSCPYCTLWADGFNGLAGHLADRAGFVVVSPDPPEVQREFAADRGWNFRMASCAGNEFAKDMGYSPEPGQYEPGVSAFQKREDGSIVRTGTAPFGPGDDYCAPWHLFDLFPERANGWAPRYTYQGF